MKRLSAALLLACLARPGAAAPAPAVHEDLLGPAGLMLEKSERGVVVTGVIEGSWAQALGLREGDKLLSFNGRKAESLADVAQELAVWPPHTRLSAVVERSLKVTLLSTEAPRPRQAGAREPETLTTYERRLKREELDAADAVAKERLQQLRTPSFRVAPGEHAWLRFPKGIPLETRTGDVLEAVTVSAMTTDSKLDFVAIPAGSSLWAQVLPVPANKPGTLKLHFFKIRLKGGHTYPCSAIVSDVSGAAGFSVSPGGSIFAARTLEGPLYAEPQGNWQISFLEPLTITEGDAFFSAGPGLWFKTYSEKLKHSFEITHIIAHRSAEFAGLKTGDIVRSIDGTSAAKLTFSEAIDRLYGPRGSTVRLRVVRRAGPGEEETVSLLRGAVYRKDAGLSFSRLPDSTVVVAKVYPGSSAQTAGLKEGDHLLSIGNLDLRQADDKRVSELLKTDLTGDMELTYETQARERRKIPLPAGWFPSVIRIEGQLSPAPQK